MAPYSIRVFGDPVLRQRAKAVTQIDGTLARLCEDMLDTMYDAPGVGLAAPQVGVGKRFFVYDVGDGPDVLINPEIVESSGEWVFDEGCLSVPGLSWDIVRPKEIHVRGLDLDGNDVDFEADEYLARLVQHELDHLDGVLLVERLEDDERRDALRILRDRALGQPEAQPAATSRFRRERSGRSNRADGGLTLP
jgi:peptide deformylase